jgi:hypothetical protein
MSVSHQTSQLDLKGLVLTDNHSPSPQRLYPIYHGTDSHSPDYDWVTAFPKVLLGHREPELTPYSMGLSNYQPDQKSNRD